MKKIAIYFFTSACIFLFLLSCASNSVKGIDSKFNATYQSVILDSNLEKKISEFTLDDSCISCIHEIYFDKIDPHSSEITLKSRTFSEEYFKKFNPLFFLTINNIRFYVFSGIEDFIVGDKKNQTKIIADTPYEHYKVWTLKMDFDSSKIIRDSGTPFLREEPAKVQILTPIYIK